MYQVGFSGKQTPRGRLGCLPGSQDQYLREGGRERVGPRSKTSCDEALLHQRQTHLLAAFSGGWQQQASPQGDLGSAGPSLPQGRTRFGFRGTQCGLLHSCAWLPYFSCLGTGGLQEPPARSELLIRTERQDPTAFRTCPHSAQC